MKFLPQDVNSNGTGIFLFALSITVFPVPRRVPGTWKVLCKYEYFNSKTWAAGAAQW